MLQNYFISLESIHSIINHQLLPGNMRKMTFCSSKIQNFKSALCLHNNDVSGLNDQLPLYKLHICQESCYNPHNSVFRGWLSMKVSLETLNLEINLKTFKHVRLKSISYTPYNQHPSLPLLFLKYMPVMYVILL